ncbi:oligosaccharide flippase family protein [Bradyrhizobium sp. McL0616]|uniref:oligosaccharide flippase family protein n=1 Tax=Bradyrhizobium sp. McL0616 TaxID=3415674 RepID=UPI003CF14D10
MTMSSRFLLKGTLWTTGAYGLGLLLRVGTNVIMTRLLAPELFGLMSIVFTLWAGVEFLTDVGIGQNIVHNKKAEDPDFYNTAWTLGVIRNAVLWLICLAAAMPMANFYHAPILAFVVPITLIGMLINGFASVGRPLLQKRMQVARIVAFDLTVSFISSIGHILLAYIWPTIWALVLGNLIASITGLVGSYLLLPGIRQRFFISKQYALEILHFGKWVFAAQAVYFLSTYFDRLYLAKVVPLEVFGIYGIARSISELLGSLVLRLGNLVLFPYIASQSMTPRADLRAHLAPIRTKFLLLAAIGVSIFVAFADLAIKLLYDERYHAATWMLPVLVIGSWFSILASVNESTLLGLGKPSYGAVANTSKFIFLLIGLALGVKFYGLLGGVAVFALADLMRYFPILAGQMRERFSFGVQDMLLTLAVFLLILLWELLRWTSGFGTSFDTLPVNVSLLF